MKGKWEHTVRSLPLEPARQLAAQGLYLEATGLALQTLLQELSNLQATLASLQQLTREGPSNPSLAPPGELEFLTLCGLLPKPRLH